MRTNQNITVLIILAWTMGFFSCSKQLKVDPPIDGLTTENVYTTKTGIDAAMVGLYNSFASYAITSNYYRMTVILSDEAFYTTPPASDLGALVQANIIPTNSQLLPLSFFYTTIYKANDIIEHLSSLPAGIITDSLKNAYLGAAKYVRAAQHFTLVTSWGDVPLVTSTSVDINVALSRTPSATVYSAIESDLKDAANLLPATVLPSSQMYVHNKYQALALLARVQLYQNKWLEAEATASTVINSGQFNLVSVINNIIKRGSSEIITAQSYSISVFQYVFYAATILPASAATASTFPALSAAMMTNFEAADLRKNAGNWLVVYNGLNYCNKYALAASATAPQDFAYQRLAELYLIRAEARIQQNNITGANSAASDINLIRARAGLGATAASDKPSMMTALEKERVCELFYEGHRWYDLKRWNKLDAVLGTLAWKSANYKPYMNLWPIATADLLRSPTLIQNPGYPQ